jgi:hypothetical protein
MGARWYDAYINRFVSPDPIIPQPGNPQSLNRYSYGYNNPVKFADPSGHWPSPGRITYWWYKTRINVASAIRLTHGRQDVISYRATITALSVEFGSVDPIMTAASIAHQASDFGERPFGCDVLDEAQAGLGKLLGKDTSKGIAQLRQQEIEQLVGPGANPYNPTDGVKGMYAKLAQANAEISTHDPSIGMTDRYMLLAIRQNSNTGNPIGYFFGEGNGSWDKMMANDGFGDSWTFQLRQVLLHLEWLIAQGWWDLPEGVDLEQWKEIVFGEQGE